MVMSLSRSHSKLSQILIKFSATTISMTKRHFFPVIIVQVYLQWLFGALGFSHTNTTIIHFMQSFV